MTVNVELLLSRPSYHAGTPVVGTVLIRRAAKESATLSCADLASARLYLAGRAQIQGRWRSAQEVERLRYMHGEHACLTRAKMEERRRWDALNGDVASRGRRGGTRGEEEAGEVSSDCGEATTTGSFCTTLPAPKVTHVEQAEHLSVDSCLHHGAAPARANDQNDPLDDLSHSQNPRDDNVICFWMTNALELLDVPERHSDRTSVLDGHGDMNPYRPLQLPDLNVVRDVFREIEKSATENSLLEENREEISLSSEGSITTENSPAFPAVASAVERARVPAATDEKCADLTTAEPLQKGAGPKLAPAEFASVEEAESPALEAHEVFVFGHAREAITAVAEKSTAVSEVKSSLTETEDNSSSYTSSAQQVPSGHSPVSPAVVASAAERTGVPTATDEKCADLTTAAPLQKGAEPKLAAAKSASVEEAKSPAREAHEVFVFGHARRAITPVAEKSTAVSEIKSSLTETEDNSSSYTSSTPQIPSVSTETSSICNNGGRLSAGNNGKRKGGRSMELPSASTPKTVGWDRIVASASRVCTASTEPPLEAIELAFSFCVDLSSDLPPTINCECIKYFYSAVLAVTTVEGELIVAHRQFGVLTPDPLHSSRLTPHQTSRVHVGELSSVAHPGALPAHVSSTEASDASPSQLNVVADPPSCDIVSLRTSLQRTSTHRIEDGSGNFCGSMTLVGLGGALIPGTRLGVHVTFPVYGNADDKSVIGGEIVPCHRVCCGLVGEEYAIFEEANDTTNNPHERKRRVKTRSYVFDSSFEMVDSGATQAISMGLVLPLDCPVTVCTQLVEVTLTLKVEFTVSSEGGYDVIRLDLPVKVVHDSGEGSDEPEEERIQTDLKLLSLRMIKDLAAYGQLL